MDYTRITNKLRKTPQKTLAAARKGLLPDLTELASFWQEVPSLLNEGILDVFYTHLDASKAPDAQTFTLTMAPPPTASRAFMSLLGLSKVGNFTSDGEGPDIVEGLTRMWPGIFKWSSFFFTLRVMPPGQRPEIRRTNMDVIAGTFYAISKENAIRKLIVATPGSIEMATKLWLLEEEVPTPSSVDIPVCTMALDSFLRRADEPSLNRALAAAGGKPDQVAKIALKRLHAEIRKPKIDGISSAISTDLNTISIVTKNISTITAQMKKFGNLNLLDVIVACFGYLRNCLESTNGFTWVAQAIKAGLLSAFIDCSPYFSKMDLGDRTMVLSILESIVPQYLVFRTVINDVHAALTIFRASPDSGKVSRIAKDIWHTFECLADERKAVERETTAMKGKTTICDNSKCLKMAPKEQFRKCAACGTTNYCSKECQAVAWKEGDHKTMCKLKQRERLEDRKHSISKTDKTFIHYLSIRDARRHLRGVISNAALDYPGTPAQGLVIRIDYTKQPESYTVKPLDGYKGPPIGGSANDEARNDALIEKVKNDQDRYTLIETIIAHGQWGQLLMTVAPSLWNLCSDVRLDEHCGDGIFGDEVAALSSEVD